MTDIADLEHRFGGCHGVKFSLLAEGLPVLSIHTEQCQARVALQGAQVLEWTPTGHKPVVWLSADSRFEPGKSIRGGVPVCWPWFGAHDSRQDFPAHGYARTVPWVLQKCELTKRGAIGLSFLLDDKRTASNMWPYNTPVELRIEIAEQLELSLITRNKGSQPVTISEALHTYFAVSDVRQVKVSGLDECDYLDKVQDFTRVTQQGDICFGGEVDRVYLDTEADCVIKDEAWQRRIYIQTRGSRSTVVWNPWIEKSVEMGDMGTDGYLSMLCVESANAASNIVTIEPGSEHCLWVKYSVD